MFLLALTGLLFAQAAPGNAIVTPPQEIHVTNTTVVNVPPMDPQAVSDADAVANQSFVVNTVQPVPVEWANALCALPNIWTTTPASVTYQFADLRDLASTLRTAALALSGLAFAAVGIAAMFGADVQERLGRLALAAVLSVGNMLWWEWGIGLNNALTGVISPPDVCASLVKPNIQLAHPDPGSAVAAPALVIVYAVVSLLLLFALAFRLGMIDVLFAGGSLAEMCWADEHTEHIAQWYQRLSIGTVYGQVLLAIGLRAAHALSSIGGGLAATLLAIVVLWICKNLLSTLSAPQVSRGGSVGRAAVGLALRRLVFKVF